MCLDFELKLKESAQLVDASCHCCFSTFCICLQARWFGNVDSLMNFLLGESGHSTLNNFLSFHKLKLKLKTFTRYISFRIKYQAVCWSVQITMGRGAVSCCIQDASSLTMDLQETRAWESYLNFEDQKIAFIPFFDIQVTCNL